MQWNRTITTRLILATAAIGTMAVLFAAVRWSSRTPAPTTAAPQDQPTGTQAPAAGRTYKVLHIMSFHSPWEWTDSQFNGFKDALRDLNVQYKVYEMDAKRQSSTGHLEQAGTEVRWLIDDWKPDLIFADDDPAQQYVAVHYLNGNIPFVFCGVNANPQDYGFDTAKNVTGVLEREHLSQSVRLLRQLIPEVRKIAIISDNAPMWRRVIARMKESASELEGIEVVSYDIVNTFEEYKTLVKSYEGKADALGFLGIFEFKGADGKNVPYQEVCRWTAENSKLPDFSFWVDRVDYGTLCAVTVSGFAQGQEAGEIARDILLDGRSPSSFPMLPTVKGEPVINLARARQLGLKPSSDVLLTAKVFTKYQWDN
jgi:ABC-type uncharacterized transport system substrate-binding protein